MGISAKCAAILLLPIVLAVLLSYLFRPIVRALARIKVPPIISAAVILAALLALIGYVPGFLAAIGLYAAARKWGGIPTGMTFGIALGVLILTCGMCLASGLLAMRKVHTADPADLF